MRLTVCVCMPSPTLSPTDPVPRGLLTRDEEGGRERERPRKRERERDQERESKRP